MGQSEPGLPPLPPYSPALSATASANELPPLPVVISESEDNSGSPAINSTQTTPQTGNSPSNSPAGYSVNNTQGGFLPSAAPVPRGNSGVSSAAVSSDPKFIRNAQRPFIGQPTANWPPQFIDAIANNNENLSSMPTIPSTPAASLPVLPSASENTMVADNSLPVQPNNSEPELPGLPPMPAMPGQAQTAPVSAPIAQVPVIQVPGAGTSTPAVPQATIPQTNQVSPAYQPPVNAASTNPPVRTAPVTHVAPVAPVAPVATAPAPAPAPVASPYMFTGGSICPLNIRKPIPGEHPMANLLPWASAGIQSFESKIHDYTCVLVKRERMKGKLSDMNSIYMKIMERPFCIYVKYLKPDAKAGQEALYCKGKNNDKLLGHDVGWKAMAGSFWLDPNGRMAMDGQRYSITNGGISNLVRKMMETVQSDIQRDPQGRESQVNYYADGGQVNGRPCIRIDVIHPVKRDYFRFHRAEIYLDKEWGIPMRYIAWMWPETQGGAPVLDEEYTFTNLKFNVGLTQHDFERDNKEYKF